MGACVLIFANKQDLKDALTAEELTQKLSLHSIKAHDWHIQSCSALAGQLLLESKHPSRITEICANDETVFCDSRPLTSELQKSEDCR